MTIAAACAPPGGGRNPVTPRFIRHFSMLCLPTPSEHSLKQIFKVRHMVALILNKLYPKMRQFELPMVLNWQNHLELSMVLNWQKDTWSCPWF